MPEESIGRYVRLVWGHWGPVVPSSIIAFLVAAAIGILLPNRWGLGLIGLMLIGFLFVAMFKVWRDEVRRSMSASIRALADDAEIIAGLVNNVIDEMNKDGQRKPETEGLESPYWISAIPLFEQLGRQARERIRIHKERLAIAGITESPLASAVGKNLQELSRSVQEHKNFLSRLADDVAKRGLHATSRFS